MKEIQFKTKKELSDIFGPIWRPVIPVKLRNQENILACEALVDSGADITLVPKGVGTYLGFTLTDGEEIKELYGIGEGAAPFLIRQIFITIGDIEKQIQAGWALIEEIPILLGRIDLFSLFDINFQQKDEIVIFAER
jgi:hypothetical protein